MWKSSKSLFNKYSKLLKQEEFNHPLISKEKQKLFEWRLAWYNWNMGKAIMYDKSRIEDYSLEALLAEYKREYDKGNSQHQIDMFDTMRFALP